MHTYILAPLFRAGLQSTYQSTKQRNFRREVDKFCAVGYRPVYKSTRVQSCPRADILSLFFYYETLDNANTILTLNECLDKPANKDSLSTRTNVVQTDQSLS